MSWCCHGLPLRIDHMDTMHYNLLNASLESMLASKAESDFVLQMNLQMTHLVDTPNTVVQTSSAALVQPLLLAMPRTTNTQTQK